jgi:hypothetical protein
VSIAFCGVGAAGASWAQQARDNVANRLAVAASRRVGAKRANGIYSSPLVKSFGLTPAKAGISWKQIFQMHFCSGIDTQTGSERFLKSWDINDLFDPNLDFRCNASTCSFDFGVSPDRAILSRAIFSRNVPNNHASRKPFSISDQNLVLFLLSYGRNGKMAHT